MFRSSPVSSPAPILAVLALALALASAQAHAAAAGGTLYDPGLGSLPAAQGWTFLTDPLFGASATQSVSVNGTFLGGTVTFDTTGVPAEKAGWFSTVPPFFRHPAVPVLNSDAGFVFSFQFRTLTESHATPDRAGFSIIATAADLRGIELGFWRDEIWAQSGPDFRHAESVKFDTTANGWYDLHVREGRYELNVGESTLLQGELRRYDSFGAPYNIPNFLFLGDDTSSASARGELGRIAISPRPRLSARRVAEGLELAFEFSGPSRTVLFRSRTEGDQWGIEGTSTTSNGVARLVVPINQTSRIFRAHLAP